MAVAEIEGATLARILSNANAHVPAASHNPYVRLRLGNGRVEVAACDNYTLAVDYAEAPIYGETDYCYLTREGAKNLESLGRSAKKLVATLTLDPYGLSITLGSEAEDIELLEDETQAEDKFAQCDQLMSAVEGAWMNSTYCAFTPNLLARFAKVKTGNADPVMDLKPTSINSVIFVKIGNTFRGCIRPIHRPKAPEGSLFNE